MSYMSLAVQREPAAKTLRAQQEVLTAPPTSASPGRASSAFSNVLEVALILTMLSGVSLALCAIAAGAFGWAPTS